LDFKFFVQRFYEFIQSTKDASELQNFVEKLVTSEFIKEKEAKLQLVKNLTRCFISLDSMEDEIMLINILSGILQKYFLV
jgi:endonuclease III-like uncharacterized protein